MTHPVSFARLGRLGAGVICTWIVLLVSPAQAGLTGYMKFPDIDGESTRRGYEGWSELSALQVDVVRATGATGGHTSGPPSIGVSFAMEADSSYPYLWLATSVGRIFRTLQVDQLNDDGQIAFKHLFHDLDIARITLTETPSGARVVGELGFVAEYDTTYFQYDSNGSLLAQHRTAFDFGASTQLATATASLPGDYNHDGRVDEADHAKWEDQYGFAMTPLGGGADGAADGVVNAADYTIWRDNAVLGVAAAAAPEPAAALLLGLAFAASAAPVIRNR